MRKPTPKPEEHPNPSGKRAERALVLCDKDGKLFSWQMCFDYNSVIAIEEALGPDAGTAVSAKQLAAYAYALTASYREDNGIDISFRDFKRMLPTASDDMRQIVMNIGAVLTANTGKDEPPGNE